MKTSDDLIALLRQRGHLAYDGEGVTQLQHGWQCARLARQDGAPPTLQLAAWLHDIGHLLTDLPDSPTTYGVDDSHEALGSQLLGTLFGRAVALPVAMHVAAKRYLVTTQPGYSVALSADSVRSLALQGGLLSVAECAQFALADPAGDAQRLRRWDDLAKNPALRPARIDTALSELAGLMAQVRAESSH